MRYAFTTGIGAIVAIKTHIGANLRGRMGKLGWFPSCRAMAIITLLRGLNMV